MNQTVSESWTAFRDVVDGGAAAVAVAAVPRDSEPADELMARLAPDEQARAARFHFAGDRAIYVTAHNLLARTVEAVLGPDGPAWSFEADGRGKKPVLRIEGQTPLYVNLSHTRGAAAVAITRRGEIGIDVEAERPLADLDRLAARVFTSNERQALRKAADKTGLFVRLWARKEAVIKACGLGLAAPLQDIDVRDPASPRVPAELAGPPRVLTDVLWQAGPQVAVAMCGSTAEHQLFEIPVMALR